MRIVGVLVDGNDSKDVVHFDLSRLWLKASFCVRMREVDEDEVRQIDTKVGNARKLQFVDDLAKIRPIIVFTENTG